LFSWWSKNNQKNQNLLKVYKKLKILSISLPVFFLFTVGLRRISLISFTSYLHRGVPAEKDASPSLIKPPSPNRIIKGFYHLYIWRGGKGVRKKQSLKIINHYKNRHKMRQTTLDLLEHKCYYLFAEREVFDMGLLKRAIQKQQWDLAAHVIVLAAARGVNREMNSHGTRNKAQKGRAKR